LDKLKAQWKKLRAGSPGRRFQDHHRRREAERTSSMSRVVWIAIGAALLLVGVFLMLVPGPGIPVFVLGAALIGQESLFVARRMDGAELWLREAFRKLRSAWARSPAWAKVLVTVAAVVIVGALSAGAYELTLGR
jgi:hypothetical protein